MEDYEKSQNYKTMNTLFSSQRDFIVIGLCGLTGSGSTEVAHILQTDFTDLGLPRPNSCPNDMLVDDEDGGTAFCHDSPELLQARHEYRMLYTFAEKNWNRFNRIKVSALITAHVLSEKKEDFCNFLKSFMRDLDSTTAQKLDDSCRDFFERRMRFDLGDWFESIVPKASEKVVQDAETVNISTDQKPIGTVTSMNADKTAALDYTKLLTDRDYFECTCKSIKIVEDKGKRREIAKNAFCIGDAVAQDSEADLNGVAINFEHSNNILYIKNCDLYNLFQQYGELRKQKGGFSSPLCYWILKQYIYEFLPETVSSFWKDLANISTGLPDMAMQQLGINLRINRTPFYPTDFKENGYEIIAEEINLAIKLLGTYQKMWYEGLSDEQRDALGREANKHILVVVDSIKNPFESMYLKRRYSNYYLMGIYTEERERERRLLKENEFSQDSIRKIDQIERISEFKKEYKKFLKEKHENPENSVHTIMEQIRDGNLYSELPFISQNVERCLEASDIFINNAYDAKSSRLYLKKSLLRYVCLIMYPGLVLPTPVERCMQTAYTAKVNSGCVSRQVGAVITDADFHILSIGWNQQPEGQLPCSYRDLCELCRDFDQDAYSDFENDENSFRMDFRKTVLEKYDQPNNQLASQGRLPSFCFKDLYNRIKGDENQVHTRSLHGEETAFLNLGAVGRGQARGGCLFTTSSPCELCAKKAMYMGISKIYYVEPYSGISFRQVLRAGPQMKRPQLILLTGAVGRAYMQLYTPLIPLKDEHEMWMGEETADIVFPGQ